MNQPLVSIITPCYNSEKFIHRYLESILNQTYNNIEIILVNDGSSDNTENIILSYKKFFKEKGIKFVYNYQKNAGVSEAINAGLKIFTGEYLCWPDPDDYFETTSIEKKVSILENNKEYAVVTSDAYIRKMDNLNESIGRIAGNNKNRFRENQFDLLLTENSVFCPICHLVRSSAFIDTNPNKTIYGARRASNWQMLLPVYYKYKRYFLNEPLCNYIIHDNNISRGDDTKEKILFRMQEHLTILEKTLKNINMPENKKCYYLEMIEERYLRKKLRCASKYRDISLLDVQYKILVEKHTITYHDKLIYLAGKYTLVNFCLEYIKYVRKIISKIKRIIMKIFKGWI